MTTKNEQVLPVEELNLLVGGTAHDLNNLLTGAQLQAALAIRKLSSDNPAATHITKVIEAMDHMALFVNHLQSQAKGGQMRNLIDLNTLINKCVNISRLLIGEDIDLELDLSLDLPYVYVDKIQVQQLILNLILNAVESLNQSGQGIIIATGCKSSRNMAGESGWWVTDDNSFMEESVYIEIEDAGSGIAKELLPRVFDPYYSTKEEGRGLGLPLVLEVVRSHNGRLLVNSHQGKGTIFKVFFPVGMGERSSKSAVYNGWAHQ